MFVLHSKEKRKTWLYLKSFPPKKISSKIFEITSLPTVCKCCRFQPTAPLCKILCDFKLVIHAFNIMSHITLYHMYLSLSNGYFPFLFICNFIFMFMCHCLKCFTFYFCFFMLKIFWRIFIKDESFAIKAYSTNPPTISIIYFSST